MSRLRIALCAEESAGVQTLRLVAEAGHPPALVLTTVGSPVASAATELGAPVAAAERVTDPTLGDRLVADEVDLLLNVHSLHLVDAAVLRAPRIGAFNLHPGPLPEYAGLNVPSWAIYSGERTHAVTLHWMSPEIDAGAIAYSEAFEIDPEETGLSLTVKCARRGLALIARLLEDAALDPVRIPADEQDPSRRRYFEPGPPDGGRLPWSSPARRVVDLVRASDYLPFDSPWGHPHSRLGERRVELVKASLSGERAEAEPGTVGEGAGPEAMIAAADEWVLAERIVVDGQPGDPAEALRPGDRLDGGGSAGPGEGLDGSGGED